MVTPSLEKIFEKEGIRLIEIEAGANYLVQEISSNSDRPVEVVVMGKKSDECHEETGVTPRTSLLSIAFERTLDIEQYPFLKSHVIDGRPVLPMSIIIEWMAHGALHGNPGLQFIGFDNFRILKGLILDESEPCTVRVLADKAKKKGSLRMVRVELCGSGGNGRESVYASADIALAAKLPEGPESVTEFSLPPYSRQSKEIYNNGLLFHGPHFHGIMGVEGCSGQGIAARVRTAPAPSAWIKHPLRNAWLADPLVLDSSFQMMILWSFEVNGIGSLPCFAGRYRQFRPVFPEGEVRVVIRVTQDNEHRALADLDFIDAVTGKPVARMENYECVMDASLNRAFRCNAV
jgi:hypothetical protein